MTIVNDATSWSPTLESSITFLESSITHQLCSQRTFIVQASLMTIVNYNYHTFIVQAPIVMQQASPFLKESVFPKISKITCDLQTHKILLQRTQLFNYGRAGFGQSCPYGFNASNRFGHGGLYHKNLCISTLYCDAVSQCAGHLKHF